MTDTPISDPLNSSPQAADPRAVLRRGREVAKELKRFVRANPWLVVNIEGSKHPRAEAWQFVAACYGHTPMITATQEQLDDAGKAIGFLAIAHLREPGGQIVSGAEAVCMRTENDWSGSPAFQLRSMAQTRACAKVTRNVFAWVMVLAGLTPTPAEEIEGSGNYHQFDGVPCYECGENRISEKRSVAMKRKYGKSMCLTCEAKEKAARAAQITNPINDPNFVAESVKQVQEKKAAQNVTDVLDECPEREDAYSL